MEHKKIVIPSLSFFQDELKGEGVVKSRRTLGELAGIFENQDAYSQLPLDQLAYEVYINPEKRNVMVVKNEMRFFYQKRNVLQI